jgi:peptidoglycan/LPS O-acetylase OafA/YrhL
MIWLSMALMLSALALFERIQPQQLKLQWWLLQLAAWGLLLVSLLPLLTLTNSLKAVFIWLALISLLGTVWVLLTGMARGEAKRG